MVRFGRLFAALWRRLMPGSDYGFIEKDMYCLLHYRHNIYACET